MERTSDAGSTWVVVDFGEIEVGQVLSVEAPDPDAFIIVAEVGSDCQPTLIESYTSGEFWQEYPDRLEQSVYTSISPAGPAIHAAGEVIDPPCGGIPRAALAAQNLVILCGTSIFVGVDRANWRQPYADPVIAIASDPGKDRVLAAAAEAGCGLGLYEVSADALSSIGSCVAVGSSSAAVAADGEDFWLWSDEAVYRSQDSGATWVAL